MPRLSFLAVAFLGMALAGCSKSPPTIQDPTELVKECQPLLSASEGTIAAGHWPPALQQLHPLEVRVETGALFVTTSREVGVGASGYVIADTPPVLDHYKIEPSGSADLFTFDFVP